MILERLLLWHFISFAEINQCTCSRNGCMNSSILKTRSLHSSETSELCETVGTAQIKVREFFRKWINLQDVKSEVYYDITSVSSYSTNIDFIEWGYNRDKRYIGVKSTN